MITTRQNVTMGLKKGNTVLLHFQYNGQFFQAILQMSGSVPGGKGGVDTHKLWKHVIPVNGFCMAPSRDCRSLLSSSATIGTQYGTLGHCIPAHSPRSIITVDQIYFIGDSRSASELEVFINMPIERLRVGCGLQCTLPHVPLVPSSRTLLISAAVKLLKFAMECDSCCTNNVAEEALMRAMYPLLCNPDEHVLSTIGSLLLALLEGKTDLPISGVFGAGKTRSAAILVVGLLVFEPNLNLMILTKENVAAQAFAEHIEGLNMPPCVTSKIGRLVGYIGYMELKKNRTKGTSLDVTCENRHDVLRQKKLLIGCGGGFQQECSQSYSPVARWITEVALTLTDESQQYGNIEETSVVARTPRTCLNICHNQNHMVHEFGLSAWVTQSKRQVISRSVTSCAGMTAYMVVVAQTKIGFLAGGRGEKFRGLPEEERRTQEEEAYARATVALTRARKMCVIFCPLDMKGLIGAATVMGSLMYGAGHCWNGIINMHLRHSSLDACPSDDQFLHLFDHMDVRTGTMAQRRYPPVALIECVADITQKHYKVRRLHLVIVDLWRPWKIHQAQVRSLTDELRRLQPSQHADCTTPLAPNVGKTPLHGRRFVYGYSLDGSDFPCYLLWPWRTRTSSFCLLESQTRRYVDLDQVGFLHPLGLRHFYDGFSLRAEVGIRSSALMAFQFQEEDVSSDLVLSHAAVVAKGWADHQEQPVDQTAPEAD